MGSASSGGVTPFEEYVRDKEQYAASTAIPGYRTIAGPKDPRRIAQSAALVEIASPWSSALFDGPFYRTDRYDSDRPAVSLVFVQSRDGNTVADNPSTLGGGETDKHLIYEGLSRVDADAVLAGSTTARGTRVVFSVWHPELVRLRLARGHRRHPAQVIVSQRGDLKFDRALMFQVPELPVFIVTTSSTAARLTDRLQDRPWIEVVDAGEPLSLTNGLKQLRARGLKVISAIGGRRTATTLLKEGLVDDIYLTTSPIDGGEPHTPYYEGPPLSLDLVVAKMGIGVEAGVRFEHLVAR